MLRPVAVDSELVEVEVDADDVVSGVVAGEAAMEEERELGDGLDKGEGDEEAVEAGSEVWAMEDVLLASRL